MVRCPLIFGDTVDRTSLGAMVVRVELIGQGFSDWPFLKWTQKVSIFWSLSIFLSYSWIILKSDIDNEGWVSSERRNKSFQMLKVSCFPAWFSKGTTPASLKITWYFWGSIKTRFAVWRVSVLYIVSPSNPQCAKCLSAFFLYVAIRPGTNNQEFPTCLTDEFVHRCTSVLFKL